MAKPKPKEIRNAAEEAKKLISMIDDSVVSLAKKFTTIGLDPKDAVELSLHTHQEIAAELLGLGGHGGH